MSALIAEMPALRAYARLICRNRWDADDLLQDTVERAWSGRDSYDQARHLRPWLISIMRNAWTDVHRRQWRTVQDVDGKRAAALTSHPEQAWRIEYVEMLQALDGLPLGSRDALLLKVAGLSFEEIAVEVGSPVATVKSRVQRARRKLAEALA